ncbi:MAG: TetR/AcrR family transcriptional regulator [Myxococcota bacterium]
MAAKKKTPLTPKAEKTVEHILATAAALLAEVGMKGFNTNLLAERAGVKVPTVYRYFPNKIAVLEELARRLAEVWDLWFDDERLADPGNDWREVWCEYIDAFVAGITAAPAGLAIRDALHSTPELRHIEDRDIKRLAERLSRALRRRDASLDAREIRAAADVLLVSGIAVLDQAFRGAARSRKARLDVLKAMHIAYLEELLD